MKNKLLAAAVTASAFALVEPVLAQNADDSPCERVNLLGQDLTDCRKQWASSKNDAEREAVRRIYATEGSVSAVPGGAAGTRGSSTPPENLRGNAFSGGSVSGGSLSAPRAPSPSSSAP